MSEWAKQQYWMADNNMQRQTDEQTCKQVAYSLINGSLVSLNARVRVKSRVAGQYSNSNGTRVDWLQLATRVNNTGYSNCC